jgi:hypothetical protein
VTAPDAARPTHRRWIAAFVTLFVALAAVVGGRLVGSTAGPRFAGHSLRHWFPKWGVNHADWENSRLPLLLEGGPEVFPLLAAALHESDTPEDLRLAGLVNSAPPPLRDWLPAHWPALERKEAAAAALMQWLARGDGERLDHVLGHLDALPEDHQVEAVFSAAYTRRADPVVQRHLRRLLDPPAPPTTSAAAVFGLLRQPEPSDETLAAAATALRRLPPGVWSDRIGSGRTWLSPRALVFALAPHTDRLARLAPIPWLASCLATGTPPLRATAVSLLPFLDPGGYPVRSTVENALPGLGPTGVDSILGSLRWFDQPAQASVRRQFVEVLAPLIFTELADAWDRRWADSPDPYLRAQTAGRTRDPGERALYALHELGPDAAAAAPYLTTYLSHPQAAMAFRAARCLARIGPCAPETIPALIPGLTNEVTAAPLVLLLAAYGPPARDAAPLLEALASDSIRFAARPTLDAFGKADAETYGFPAPAELRTLRREGPLTPFRIAFTRNLAVQIGLTNIWRELIPTAAASGTGATSAVPSEERRTLAELAALARRRLVATPP